MTAYNSAALIEQGKQALYVGNKQAAWIYFQEALEIDPANEEAWLWAGGAAPTLEKTIECLQQVLRLNPQNERARSGLDWAHNRLAAQQPPAAPAKPQPEPVIEQPVPVAPPPPAAPPEPPKREKRGLFAFMNRSTIPPEPIDEPSKPVQEPPPLSPERAQHHDLDPQPSQPQAAVQVKQCARCGYYNPASLPRCMNCNAAL